MRVQYRPGVWSQCPGSYGLINSWSWRGTGSHRPDHARLAGRNEESSLWHMSGHGSGQRQLAWCSDSSRARRLGESESSEFSGGVSVRGACVREESILIMTNRT